MLFSATISPEVDALARRAPDGTPRSKSAAARKTAEGIEHVIVAVDKAAEERRVALDSSQTGSPSKTLIVHAHQSTGRQARHVSSSAKASRRTRCDGERRQKPSASGDARPVRSGAAENLVATDIAARGIDGRRDPGMVVNYGRSAGCRGLRPPRGPAPLARGARGLALTLISPMNGLLMADVERLIGQNFPREVDPGFESVRLAASARTGHRRGAAAGASLRPRRGGKKRR